MLRYCEIYTKWENSNGGRSKRIKFNDNSAVIAVITEDKRIIGIVVDKVDDVQKIDSSTLSPVSDMGSAIPSKYLKDFVRLKIVKCLY